MNEFAKEEHVWDECFADEFVTVGEVEVNPGECCAGY